MVVMRIKGGLGNQLFQYAAGLSMSRRLGTELYLDTSFYPTQTLRGFKLPQLNCPIHQLPEDVSIPVIARVGKTKLNKVFRDINLRTVKCFKDWTYILETPKEDLVPEFFSAEDKNIYVDGYYQSVEYFSDMRNELLYYFRPNYQTEQEYLKALADIKKSNAVAVHVRRGDFQTGAAQRSPKHYLLGKNYYNKALEWICKEIKSPVFFWFSDDIEWVKENFGEQDNFQFISMRTEHADIDEMMLMKHCKHVIAANSTFSWWGSWLNEYEDAVHICPAKCYGNLHMIPDHWVKIPVE